METELLVLRETKVMQQNKITEFDGYRVLFSERVDAARKYADEVEFLFTNWEHPS
jgi:hypothetical protein